MQSTMLKIYKNNKFVSNTQLVMSIPAHFIYSVIHIETIILGQTSL